MSIWGHPANLLKINNNQILCTYGYRKNPIGIRAVILDEHDLRIISDEFIIRSDGYGNPYDSGYPMTLKLKNGSFISCYYFTSLDNVTHIAATIWKII